jgi:murein DD-endopeptidase MepM/ murein hydrolase activator NlpD
VRTAGSNGTHRITAEISFIGSEEISRVITGVEVVTEAVNRVILVGTRVRPSTTPTGTFIRPLSGRISQFFTGTHRGIDIPAARGTSVLAADGGTVITARFAGSYGNYVEIRHANGYISLYAHLHTMNVRVGDRVFQGQVIGGVGSTGRSTGNHLHFEIIRNGVKVNPLNYVPR